MKFKFRAPENPTLLLIDTTRSSSRGQWCILTAQLWPGKGGEPTGRKVWSSQQAKYNAVRTYKYPQSLLLMGDKPFQIYEVYWDVGRKSQEMGEFRFWNALSQITESADLRVVGIMQLSLCLSLSPLKPVSYFFHLTLLKIILSYSYMQE